MVVVTRQSLSGRIAGLFFLVELRGEIPMISCSLKRVTVGTIAELIFRCASCDRIHITKKNSLCKSGVWQQDSKE